MRGMRNGFIGLLLTVLLLAACGTQTEQQSELETAAAVSGILEVLVEGLPSVAEANISISGPRNYSQQLTASTTLRDIQPGGYAISAEEVEFLSVTYTPSVEPAAVDVKPNPHGRSVKTKTSTVTVTYARPDLGEENDLIVSIAGLPEGVEANLRVVGPDGFLTTVAELQRLQNLEPGSYTISAFSVLAGGSSLSALSSGSVTVFVPETPSVTVTLAAGEEFFFEIDYLQPTAIPSQEQPDWREEVIYFVMTDRFKNGDPANDNGADRPGAGDEVTTEANNPLGWHGGDFAGLTQKIESGYFQDMGFTAIWLTPVYLQVPAIAVGSGPHAGKQFAGYHGYWAEDFMQVDPHFGTFQEYQELILTAREHGIRIIQDMVVNHTGYDAVLTETRPEWFHTECTSIQSCPLAGLPDLDDRIPEVRDFLNATVRYWVDNFGIDGIRMDTVKHVYDDYWQRFFAEGGPADPNVVWTVGEIFDGSPGFIAHYMDNLGLPAAFDFPLYFRIKDHLSHPGGNLNDVAVIFDQDSAYSDPSRLVTFIDNHDVPRFMSEALNRGVPQASAVERLDMALSFIYTVRGTPSVYYGTENAMAGKGDPYSHPSFEGNRVKMDFTADAPLRGRLAALAEVRQDYRALTHGNQQELWRPHGGPAIFAFSRTLEGEAPVVVVLNNGDSSVDLSNLHGGGIPLLGTIERSADLTEVTGRDHDLAVDASGRLVGTIPSRTLLAVTGTPGTPEEPELTSVTFTVDARSQGAAQIELRRFDTGAEERIPMTPVVGQPGFWTTTLEVQRPRTLSFKFGNATPGAPNSGYEGFGQGDRTLQLLEAEMSYSGVFNFTTIPTPEGEITGTITSGGSPLAGARVTSSLNANVHYAFTNTDGTYHLPHPAGSTSLTASAPSHSQAGPVSVTAPATGVDFTLTATTKYVIDGNLAGWTPRATLSSPDAGLWGGDNNFIELLVDWDDTYLYLGYHYRAWGNSAILYMDTSTGGSVTASEFNAWPRRADFATGVNYFLAQYQGDPIQLWQVNSTTSTTQHPSTTYERATVGTFPAFTTEVAIPWSQLGYSSRPNTTLNFYAGIFGDNWGAGDIAPNTTSTPFGNNTINESDQNNAIFNSAFSVTIGQ